MSFPTQEAVKRVKAKFPKGTRVKLIRMSDPNAPAPGSLGTVQELTISEQFTLLKN